LPGYAFKSELFDDEEGIPLIRVRDIGKNRTETNYRGSFDPQYIVKNGEILVGMDGEFNVCKWNGQDALLNQRVCKVTPDSNRLEINFLFFVLQTPIKAIEHRISLTTVRHLSTKELQRIRIPLPPLVEQQEIATILSTVDDAIQKTDEIIAKTQQLKKGLMQQLLTKGIGHTKFKQTEIGEIPAHWRLVPLGRTTREPIRNGYSPICPSEPTGKWVLKLSAVSEEGFREDQVKPAPANDSNVDRTRLHQNDILVSRSNTRNLVGLAGMYGGVPSNCSYPDLMMRIRVEESILAPWYLEQWLLHPRVRSFFHSMARGTSGSMVKVDRAIVERLPVPVPPLEEQQEIISVASAAIGKLHGERQTQDALQQLKKGLMQILLTAKIRVKVD